mmetsp:Transcript_1052/g.2701  ORF Transcript_1052/g.2701 Transcript_1052/m.2701 type:complete len:149 (-) Transcript_1052:183-629(-)
MRCYKEPFPHPRPGLGRLCVRALFRQNPPPSTSGTASHLPCLDATSARVRGNVGVAAGGAGEDADEEEAVAGGGGAGWQAPDPVSAQLSNSHTLELREISPLLESGASRLGGHMAPARNHGPGVKDIGTLSWTGYQQGHRHAAVDWLP